MTTSVVIPVYNGVKYLQKNLPGVIKLEADEVVIVDDASTDGSAEFVRQNFPQVILVQHIKNTRFPISVNDGFKKATGDIVFLLNQDLAVDKDLIKNTLPNFKDAKLFAVTFAEKERSWARAKIIKGFLEFDNGPRDNQIHESFWASGGSAAFRKSMWDSLGGFDPIFTPGYFEDLDLGWRAGYAGLRIIWDPKCKVDHETETAFTKAFSEDKLRLIKERNYLLVHWKNLSRKQLVEHVFYLVIRILRHPGFIIPTVMAICRKLVS